jgi:hypothetical protein
MSDNPKRTRDLASYKWQQSNEEFKKWKNSQILSHLPIYVL